jgi:hypothetical protein
MGDETTVEAGPSPLPPERVARWSVAWDEVAPGRALSRPSSGSLLFLWPRLREDRRRPDWTRRPGEEDEYQPWWNREDSKVSAALLRPFYEELVASLAEQAGPPRFYFVDRFRAMRRVLGHLDTDRSLRVLSGFFLARPSPLEELAALVEGAEGNERSACTVTFGNPDRSILHVRHNERCLWLWLAPGQREGFDRLLARVGWNSSFLRTAMDWERSGTGLPAPLPPDSLRR